MSTARRALRTVHVSTCRSSRASATTTLSSQSMRPPRAFVVSGGRVVARDGRCVV